MIAVLTFFTNVLKKQYATCLALTGKFILSTRSPGHQSLKTSWTSIYRQSLFLNHSKNNLLTLIIGDINVGIMQDSMSMMLTVMGLVKGEAIESDT